MDDRGITKYVIEFHRNPINPIRIIDNTYVIYDLLSICFYIIYYITLRNQKKKNRITNHRDFNDYTYTKTILYTLSENSHFRLYYTSKYEYIHQQFQYHIRLVSFFILFFYQWWCPELMNIQQ